MNSPRVRLLAFALAVVALAVAAFLLPVAAVVLEVVDQVRGTGVLGAVIYGGVYVLATVLMVPGSLITLLAGFLYGVGGGVLVVWPASVLGAALAFLGARFLARAWVAEKVARSPRLLAVDEAIGERAFAIIFLLRLSPLVPFSLLNYALGVTRARFGHYLLAPATGMLPGTVLYVYLGSLAQNATELASGIRPSAGLVGQSLWLGGLLATALVTVWISRLASAQLRARVPVATTDADGAQVGAEPSAAEPTADERIG